MEGLAAQRGSLKRTFVEQHDAPSVSTATTSGSVATAQSGLGSPTISKRCRTSSQQHGAGCNAAQFPVLEYHLQQCQQMQGTFLNNTLLPADSSTWSNWQQLQQELLNQADVQMADSAQPLTRSNSAPELVKLTQADSGAWQQAHAASNGGSTHQPAPLLSHKDFWLT